MDVSKQLDFDQQQKNIDSPGFQRREAAMQSRAALLRSSQSASLAGSMMNSLSFGASIGSSITASSQATMGETPLLLPGRPFRTTRGPSMVAIAHVAYHCASCLVATAAFVGPIGGFTASSTTKSS